MICMPLASVVVRTAETASANDRGAGAASTDAPTATEASAPPTHFNPRMSSDSMCRLMGAMGRKAKGAQGAQKEKRRSTGSTAALNREPRGAVSAKVRGKPYQHDKANPMPTL